MKWVGHNIEHFISRFRQKVYLESADIEIRKVSGQPTLELSAWSATATAAHAGRIKFLKSGTATVDTYTAGNHTTSGEILGRIEAYGIDDADGETLSSYIEFANDAVSDADSSPGKIVFATSDADDAGTPTVRLTIDDGGLATFVGAISVGGNLTFDSVALTGIQTSAESFVDNDVSIMTSAAIDDRINTAVTAEDLDVAADSGTAAVDLNSQSLTVTGGTNATTSATGQAVTINVDDAFIKNDADDATSGALTVTGAAGITINDATTSSATEGGNLVLASDDGAVMASGHRLGVIEFKGAEDTGSTLTTGARIEALTDAIWSASENGASLKFYTTDGNASESLVLTLDSDKVATFAGNIRHINTTTSSATEGGVLGLISDDGAALGDDHRLGAVLFRAAEDSSNSLITGASIQAFADAAWSASENGTRLEFYINDGNNSIEKTLTLDSDKKATFTGQILISNTTTSSSTEGGTLRLLCDDGAALGDDHRLGGINFQAAEDGSSTLRTGASIQAFADAAWSASENGTRMEFRTMDGNNSPELSLTLDSDLLATFAGDVTISDNLVLAGVDGASLLQFTGTSGGGGEGIQYEDAGGSNRYAINFPGSDVVAISNRASNGTVQIRANTSTAGSGGEVTAATFTDTETTLGGDLVTSGGDVTLGTAGNTTATTLGTIVNTGTNAGKALTISAGSTTTGSNNINGGTLTLASGGGDGTGTSQMLFSTKKSGTDAAAERMRINARGQVVVGGDGLHQGYTPLNVVHDYVSVTFENQIADSQGGGEILYYGGGQAGDQGSLHFLHTDATWDATDADAVATGASQMLGIALGESPNEVGSGGMLFKGFLKVSGDFIEGSPVIGAPVYVSEVAGKFDFTAPSGTGDFVRIVGYCLDVDEGAILLHFDPDKTWVEVA